MVNSPPRTWAEIDLSALKNNYDYLRNLAPNSQFLGLCKANAYGHDPLIIARALQEFGCEMLAVACCSEGVFLRKSGIDLPILVLGDSSPWVFDDLLQYDLTATLHDSIQAKQLYHYLESAQKELKVHFKVDSGMGRLGFQTAHREETVAEISHFATQKLFLCEGIFTHFPSADCPTFWAETQKQRGDFLEIVARLSELGIHFPLVHMANSASTLFHPESHGDMIRAGISLYGYSPDGGENPNLQPVLSLKSRIAVLRQLPSGTSVSYGGTVTLSRDSLVAVLPVGYGDGLPRGLSNYGTVEVLGRDCPILGRICMDMTMVDVTELENQVEIGMETLIYGKQSVLEKYASSLHTISYELLCQISSRVPRIPVNPPRI